MSSLLKPIPLPEQQAILIPLQSFVNEILGDAHWRPISFEIAAAIYTCTNNEHTCYVQLPSDECPEIIFPLLWNFQAWSASIEKWRRAKAYSEKQRIEGYIFQENIKRIANALLKQWSMNEGHAMILANKWMRKNDPKISALNIKLATTIEDIP